MWTKVLLTNPDTSQRLIGWVELTNPVNEGDRLLIAEEPGHTWQVLRVQRTSETTLATWVLYTARLA
jgi:hypothetical protein